MTRTLAIIVGVGLLLQGCGGNPPPPPPVPTITDINGGLTGSGTVGSLFIIDGNNFGDLSAAPPGYSPRVVQ